MPDDSDARRDALHEFLQDQGATMQRPAILTGWVVVLEWMDDEGERWLSKAHSASLPAWSAAGLHHEALYGHWPSPDDVDE